MVTITDIRARRVWDSRGFPTIEVEIHSESEKMGRAVAPAGASTGRREAATLVDGGNRLGGKDVIQALGRVSDVLWPALVGMRVESQEHFDHALLTSGGSTSGSPVGANTTTAVSLAMVQLLAQEAGVAPWQILGPTPITLPRPQIQIMGGGAHAAHRVAVQDFMVLPLSATDISDALIQVSEVYRAVGEILACRGNISGVADEGGYWPQVSETDEALDTIVQGVTLAGLNPGVDVGICLDIAATQFYRDGHYVVGDQRYNAEEWVAELARMSTAFPIVSIEDPVHEDDEEAMALAVSQCSAVIVGDDYLVTHAERIKEVRSGSVEAALIKVNQVGTVTEAHNAVLASRKRGLQIIVSARSGETEDVSVTHLATGWQADMLKVGSITRGERTAKWNELLRISETRDNPPLAKVVTKAGHKPPQT